MSLKNESKELQEKLENNQSAILRTKNVGKNVKKNFSEKNIHFIAKS